jgi:hypothetical protein
LRTAIIVAGEGVLASYFDLKKAGRVEPFEDR